MKKQDGIALIATLLIMAAIMALGVGTLFLSNMNLRIAENSRTHAIARYNAEAGIEAAIVKLKKDYEASTPKQFPANLILPNSPDSTVQYSLAIDPTGQRPGYKLNASKDQAEVRIVGTVLNNSARYQTEALVAASAAKTKFHGIETEGVVDISSGTSIYTDAGVHGNAGVSLGNSDFYTCLSRDASGTCTSTKDLHASDIPVSTSNNASCSVKGESYTACNRNREPVTVNPDYLAKRDRVIQAADVRNVVPPRPSTPSSANGINCDKVVNATSPVTLNNSDLTPGKVICIQGNGDVTIPDDLLSKSTASLSGVTIIADGNIGFDKNSDVYLSDNTTLISKNGTVSLGKKSSVMDSHIFSQGSVDYNGQQNTFGGVSTIATAGNISIGGSSKIAIDSSNNKGIGIAMIAGGNVDVNGSSQWFAGIVAGGTVSANGGPTLSGGIQAKGTITIKGGIDIDSGLAVFNDNLVTKEPNFASRR